MKQEYNRIYSYGEWIKKSNEAYENLMSLGRELVKSRDMSSKNNRTAFFSNYGNAVDIYAPGFVNFNIRDNDGKEHIDFNYGTSFSSPIVGGITASIMSEIPYHNFNTKK